jgi:hypothetical protein
MEVNSSWGADEDWSTNYIPDSSAPTCWTLVDAFTVDTTAYRTDTTLYRTDRTQI